MQVQTHMDTLVPLYATCSADFAWPPADTPTDTSTVWTGPDGLLRLAAFSRIKKLIGDSLVMHFPDYSLDWTVDAHAGFIRLYHPTHPWQYRRSR